MSCIEFVDNVSGTRKLLNFGFICVLTIVTSQTFAAPLVTFDSIDVGWYRNQGYHYDTGAALAGCDQTLWRWDYYASYFIFDLSSVSEEFQSGRLFVPIFMYWSSDAQESIVLYDIITPVSDVMASHTGANMKPSIFEDLRSGAVYGSTTVTAADVGTEVAIDLTSEALNSLNGNTGYLFGIGIYLNNLRGRSVEYVHFIGAHTSVKARLELEIVPEPEPMVYYVDDDANGLNDGSSWVNAFNDLQDALAVALSGDEIRVAEGIYKPDEDTAHPSGTGNRSATFQLRNRVTIKGGYAGFGEPDPNARDIDAHETILSGDLMGNDDDPGYNTRDENSYHVVTSSSTNATAVLDGCTITAGVAFHVGPNDRGGGIYNSQGNPTILNCTFRANSATSGGGMHTYRENPTLSNCTFSGNWATYGGGISILDSSPRLNNCIFTGNLAIREDGGGIKNNNSSPVLINCLFITNSANKKGGAVHNDGASHPTLVNCTFTKNSATWGGGGIFNYSGSRPTLTNCILWANSGQVNGGTPVINYSCIQGWTGALGGTGNINSDPLFLNPSNDDLHLLPASPCIDTGDPCYVAEPNETDLAGNPRVMDGRVDMGAYECSYVEASMKFTPQALNLSSGGKLVKAHFVLPEDFSIEDVDSNTPAVIEPLGMESEYMNVFINGDGFVEIEAAFSRADFCGTIMSNEPVEVTVIGQLATGRYFYGTGTIRIINKKFEQLAVLSSYWLEGDCDLSLIHI